MNQLTAKFGIIALCAVLTLLSVHTRLLAATGGTTGDIQGYVKDESGQGLPGVYVTLVQTNTNETKVVETNEEGYYRARFLSLGPYKVVAELMGLGKVERVGINVTIGAVLTVDLILKTMTVEESMVVTAEPAPIIETVKTENEVTIDNKMMQNMPSAERSWLNHMKSIPGATAIDDDYRVQVGGQRAITNSIMMDGTDANSNFFGEQRGGTRPAFTFSQESVQEFQVINAGYSAEYGRAAGAVVNAVTKSGTNELKSSIFYLYKDASLVSKNAYGYEKEEFKQQQGGFNVGGPLIADKAFFFFNFDGQDLNRPVYVRMRRPELAEKYNERYIQTEDQYSFLLKTDFILGSNHKLSVRDNFLTFKSENGTFTSSTSARENNGLEKNQANSFVTSLTSTLSPSSFNELRVQYSVEKRPRMPNTMDTPEVSIGSIGTFGQLNYLPSVLDEYLLQIIDNYNFTTFDHDVKMGTDLSFYRMKNWFPRYFGGQYIFDTYNDYAEGDNYTYTQAFDMSGDNGHTNYNTGDYAFYVQDTWRAAKTVTINAGLRYDFQDQPKPQSYDSTVPDEWKGILPHHPKSDRIPEDSDNFGPRLGIAWDPKGDNKMVVKFGAGIYYPRTPSLLVANALSTNGYRVVRITVGPRSGPGRPDPATGYFPRFDSLPTTADRVTPDIYVFDDNFENPETLQYSFSFDRELMKNYAVGLQYIYAHTTKLERLHDINLKPAASVDANGREQFGYSRTTYRYDDRFGKIVQFESTAESIYNAVTVKAEKRWSEGKDFSYQLMTSYTYAKSEDDDSNERSVGTTYGFADNQFHYENEWGPSDFDVEHRAVLNGTIQAPYGIRAGAFMVYQTGKPWSATTGDDSNHDSYRTDRPYENGKPWGRNSFRQPDYKTIDMHLSWAPTSLFFKKHDFEMMMDIFNVFNWDNLKIGYSNQVYNATSPDQDFGRANIAGLPRTIQLGMRYRFR